MQDYYKPNCIMYKCWLLSVYLQVVKIHIRLEEKFHGYIFHYLQLAEALNMELTQVEDFLTGDDKVRIFPNCILIYILRNKYAIKKAKSIYKVC